MSQQKHRQQLIASRGTAAPRNFQPRVTKVQQRVIQARQTVPTPAVPSEISPQAAGDLQPVQTRAAEAIALDHVQPFNLTGSAKANADFAKQVNDKAWDQLKQAADVELQKDAELAATESEPTPESTPESEPAPEPVVDDSPETDDGPLLEHPSPAEYET